MKVSRENSEKLSVILNDILGLTKYLNSVLPKQEQNLPNPPVVVPEATPPKKQDSLFGDSLKSAFVENPGEA